MFYSSYVEIYGNRVLENWDSTGFHPCPRLENWSHDLSTLQDKLILLVVQFHSWYSPQRDRVEEWWQVSLVSSFKLCQPGYVHSSKNCSVIQYLPKTLNWVTHWAQHEKHSWYKCASVGARGFTRSSGTEKSKSPDSTPCHICPSCVRRWGRCSSDSIAKILLLFFQSHHRKCAMNLWMQNNRVSLTYGMFLYLFNNSNKNMTDRKHSTALLSDCERLFASGQSRDKWPLSLQL